MGVSGCGKSTLAAALASAIRARFCDADDLHPAENIAKMARGEALTDADRGPWLQSCGAALRAEPKVVLACSALRRAYRDQLRAAVPDLRFVHLAAPQAVLAARLVQRQGHFMPQSLLASQYAVLEVPTADEALELDAMAPLDQLLDAVLRHL